MRDDDSNMKLRGMTGNFNELRLTVLDKLHPFEALCKRSCADDRPDSSDLASAG